MCRLIAVPPGYPIKKTYALLSWLEGRNIDGFGYSYVQDRKFITKKWPTSFKEVSSKQLLFEHMPYSGWTIIHLRAASHGENTFNNTHPFETENFSICHNGIFTAHDECRLILESLVDIKGETDSEIAAQIIEIAGPKKFAKRVEWSGVFLCLHRNGTLWTIKTSGDLVMHVLKRKQILIASELPPKFPQVEALIGWYHFDKYGHYLAHKKVRDSFMSNFPNDIETSSCSTYASSPYSSYSYYQDKKDSNYNKDKYSKHDGGWVTENGVSYYKRY